MRRALLFALGVLACEGSSRLPPQGEALIVVDTDVAIPTLLSRVRIDIYSGDGKRWLETRDLPILDSRDLPVSFSVYSPDDSSSTALVRLRGYLSGRTRAFRGERFFDIGSAAPALDPAFPEDGVPMTVEKGTTPSEEPQPFVTIDRLVVLDLVSGKRGRTHVVLHGACFGTMADIAGQRTCIDSERQLVAAVPEVLDQEMGFDLPKEPTTFGVATPCPSDATPRPGRTVNGQKLFDEEVCIVGSAYMFGTPAAFGRGDRSGVPEHIAVVPPFYIDTFEVTVGRFRDAIARGFKTTALFTSRPDGLAIARDTCSPNKINDATMWCTYSATPLPGASSLEAYAMTCVSWEAARAFCQFEGGDLLTEAQWEYAALVAARPTRTRMPWGDDLPSCSGKCNNATAGGAWRAVIERLAVCAGGIEGREGCLCKPGAEACGFPPPSDPEKLCGLDPDFGPQPVDQTLVFNEYADKTATGIVGFGGGVSELVRDAFAGLDSVCFARSGPSTKMCDEPTAIHAKRGAAWSFHGENLPGGFRWPNQTKTFEKEVAIGGMGFRCMRPVSQ